MEQTSQPQTKVCKRCHQERPVSEFAVSSKSADGLQSWCRSCHRQNYIEKEKLGGAESPLSQFKPRELIEELRKRGYSGKLKYVYEIVV
jgi:hypothetical protein